ncbi:YARHG domain-containing protein [Flavobacterium sp. MC2016-06]|uniref:YARHG domain-containing protein n=1 Tax=Flavobacterium sp. MC2016-06 TaxID=2676308 RepID=UPI0012BAEF9E|nr:YARHG domain-containing protein [Flavobacterium sp. MC2016-06]MBU3860172.1 YARHG domain-containing protein [Flavobacterium sp. MC2016-06]
MKKLVYFLFAVLLFSCNSKDKNNSNNDALTAQNKEIRTDLYGSWVGDFLAEERNEETESSENTTNKINILIKKITASEVTGQSIVAGNSRPLKGFMKKIGNTLSFTLKEPGDDKNDGVFTFEIKNDTLVGTWTAYNTKKAVTKRSFELSKKEFQYDPTVMLSEDKYVDWQNPKVEKEKNGILASDTIPEDNEEYDEASGITLYRQASESVYQINSSTEKLKESQLKNLKKLDLEILRNTIFARHGLTFKTKTVRQFFDFVDWYIPVSTNVDDKLTETEKQNIVLLKRFEKYATDNYDSFGR